MADISSITASTLPVSMTPKAVKPEMSPTSAEAVGQRFEQMLWTEMLSYAGLEKAFAQGSGEAATAFSRYVVEAVAKDLSVSHPLGLSEAVERSIAASKTQAGKGTL